MNRQQIAFHNSAKSLQRTTGKLYFWTFTFAKVYNAWEYRHLWHRFALDFQHLGSPMFMGLRVVQMHETHGFHYHCIFNEWIDARRAWRVCRKHGMGHIDAKAIRNTRKDDVEGAIGYLTRYLTSSAEKFPVVVRRWGGMYGAPITRMRDMQLLSPCSDSISYLTKLWGRGQFGRDTINAIVNSPHCQSGDWRTLMCGIDYKQFKLLRSFNWRESEMERRLSESPWRDWVTKDCTIFRSNLLPSFIDANKSLYWSTQKAEEKSCSTATFNLYYRINPNTGVLETYEK